MTGSNHLNSPNEPNGLEIWYFTGQDLKDSTRFEIENFAGEVVYKKAVLPKTGIEKIYWNTAKAEPGSYKVTIKNGKYTETKTGVVQERWIWPVLNYRKK
jgi:hypothetical protein